MKAVLFVLSLLTLNTQLAKAESAIDSETFELKLSVCRALQTASETSIKLATRASLRNERDLQSEHAATARQINREYREAGCPQLMEIEVERTSDIRAKCEQVNKAMHHVLKAQVADAVETFKGNVVSGRREYLAAKEANIRKEAATYGCRVVLEL